MNLYNKEVQKYLENHTKERSEVLSQLDRRTYVEMLMPQMISGHVQGNLLSMIVKLVNAKTVLEIGTFTGYATICIAKALPEDGIVYTIEKNPEFTNLANDFWLKAGVNNKIKQHVGEALEVLPDLDEQWDFVFIDAAKKDYEKYYDLVLPKLKKGGLILADNVLWSGKVIWEPDDPMSQKLDSFNKMVVKDERVENVILPLRDGIHLIRKK